MVLNGLGYIVKKCWYDLPKHYHNCILDQFVVMPNHVHAIIKISDPPDITVGAGLKPAPTNHPLTEILRGFKTFSSRRINEIMINKKFKWQRSYHDRIIRNYRELCIKRKYIFDNPMKWWRDRNNRGYL